MELVGKTVPGPFKLPLLTGGEIELPPSTNHGPLLLDFGAIWCKPSRQATPLLAAIARDYAAQGVRFVAVNQGENPERIRRYLANENLAVAVALDKPTAAGSWCQMARAFQVEAIPTIVLVGPTNVIRFVHVGATPELASDLRRALDAVLKDEPVLEQGATEGK